jgi:TonB family protein
VVVVRPVYPSDASRLGVQGLAVAEVHVATDGSVSSVKCLAAPGDQIREAMSRALTRWRFKPLKDEHTGIPAPYRGKLTYYFVKRDGQWVVLDPSESFFVGPAFAR